MACDVEANRRRRLWESDQAAVARELAGVGFQNKGQASRDWWIQCVDVQNDSRWAWLESGLLLENVAPDPGIDGQFFGANTGASTQATMRWNGYPTVQFGVGLPDYSLLVELQLDLITPIVPAIAASALAVSFLLAPAVNLIFGMDNFSMIFPPGTDIPPPNGAVLAVPLARCHSCST